MIEREKVIKGLECCKEWGMMDFDCTNTGCPYEPHELDCVQHLHNDTLAMLKAQEPRVMTMEEVQALQYGHVLIELDKSDPIRWVDALLFCKNTNFSFDFITLEGRARLLGAEYNKEWRCWTSCPTDAQREAIPWKN